MLSVRCGVAANLSRHRHSHIEALFRRRLSFERSLVGGHTPAGISFGALVSVSRLAVGAHFFSDVVVSFFVMWIRSDVLHHYMLIRPPAPERMPARVIPVRPEVG
jgi:hypothetical protein